MVLPFDQDLKIIVRPIDRLGRRIFLDGYSEPDFAIFLEAYLRHGMTFFDVGAHFGQYTLMAAKRVRSEGAVHAFEPTAETFLQLEANVRLNGFKQVVMNHAAIYDHAGEMALQACVTGQGEFNSLGRPILPAKDVVRIERVRTITIDDYCHAMKIRRIDLMKIDVEGAELHVLRGARELLARQDAPTIVCEFNEQAASNMGSSTRELRAAFETLGYVLFTFNATTCRVEAAPMKQHYEWTENLIAAKNPDGIQAQLTRGRRSLQSKE